MMKATDIIRLPDPKQHVRIELREAIVELAGRPHVFLRMRITGWRFPHRAPEPFVLVGDVVSHHVRIAPDELSADAYFDQRIPANSGFSFGYGRIIEWDFDVPVDTRGVELLDRARLGENIVDPFEAGQAG